MSNSKCLKNGEVCDPGDDKSPTSSFRHRKRFAGGNLTVRRFLCLLSVQPEFIV